MLCSLRRCFLQSELFAARLQVSPALYGNLGTTLLSASKAQFHCVLMNCMEVTIHFHLPSHLSGPTETELSQPLAQAVEEPQSADLRFYKDRQITFFRYRLSTGTAHASYLPLKDHAGILTVVSRPEHCLRHSLFFSRYGHHRRRSRDIHPFARTH
jgi:hypothetical protein